MLSAFGEKGSGRLSRLFISHSSTDNVAAKAFKQWLGANGWPDDDVFLDVDDIGAGERWKEALRNANTRCEAVVLLASPDALSSPECLAEVRKAEDYGKEIVVVLLRDLTVEDRRLDSYRERQIVDLSASPIDHVETVEYRGETQTVRFNARALQAVRAYLVRRGITPDHFAWPPAGNPEADPFPGLSAFTEDDAGIFFGRDADILRGLDKLRIARRNGRPRTLVIQASSGAGKSSYLRAGLWPRLERDPDFAPLAIVRPAQGAITGPNGLGRKLAVRASRQDRPVNPGEVHTKLRAADTAAAVASFTALMQEAAAQAHAQRRVGDPEARPPALVVAVDQAEELFASEDAEESARLVDLLATLVVEPPPGVELYVLFAIRSDSADPLFQMLMQRGLEVPETLPLLPMPRTSYREVIAKPLDVLARRGKTLSITADLVERLIDDSAGADALPLLAFTLSNLYKDFGAGTVIGVAQYAAIGGVAGCIERALKGALAHPGDNPAVPAGKPAQLAQLKSTFIPWLARISPETGQPMRRVARRDEFTAEQIALVDRLVAARLLVADRREGADVVEIAHESLLRQWPELAAWLADDSENLKAVESVERAARDWERAGRHRDRLEHRARRLREAVRLAARPDFHKRLGAAADAYLRACQAEERRRAVTLGLVVGGLLVPLVGGALAWRYQSAIADALYWFSEVRPYTLAADRERDLQALERFRECTDCPDMVALPAASYLMGAPPGQGDATGREYDAHAVSVADFAIAETPITFAQYNACAAHGDCTAQVALNTADDLPAVNVTWDDARRYAAWLARVTGKPYRLLSEAEYEYAARGGTTTRFPWGENAGRGNANCADCGTRLSRPAATPVGAFPANKFGLRDMVGNVFQWVGDCFYPNYEGAPLDGSVWDKEGCTRRVVRGASWLSRSALLRSSWRDWREAADRQDDVGFRVGRTVSR